MRNHINTVSLSAI